QIVGDYLKQTKEPPVQLARAAFEAAIADPRSETLVLMELLLSTLEAEPRHVEVLMTARLQALNLPRAALQRPLELVRDSEQAAAEPRLQPFVSRELEQAFQLRHEALVMLESAGYTSPEEADTLLAKAAAQVTSLLAIEDGVREALTALDRARVLLPGQLV